MKPFFETLYARTRACSLLAVVACGPVFAETAVSELPDGRNLRSLVDYALTHNPRVNAARQAHLGTLQQVPQASALPDPKLSYRYFFDEVETRVGPQEYAVGISQALPWFGKLKLQQVVASDAARAAAQRVASVRNSVIAQVASAWYELYYLEASTDIVRGSRDLVVHLERVARVRYGTGAATHADVIRAQVELGTIENRLASLTDERGPLLARLNSALHLPLNRPLNAAIDASQTLSAAMKIQPLIIADDVVLQRVALNNPDLRVSDFELAAAKSMKSRAQKNHRPDFTVGLDYIATGAAIEPDTVGSSNNALSATIGITLPIWRSKYTAEVKEAEAEIQKQQYSRDEQLSTLHAETITTLFRLRDAQRQVDLYDNTLLPKAKESLVATQSAYSTSAAPFADMIDAQRVLLAFELAYARAATDHHQARTRLEKLTGEALQEAASFAGVQP